MLEVYDLKVRSLDVDFFGVFWKIKDTTFDVLDYVFQIQRSESPGGPWDNLGDPLVDKYQFFDRAVHQFHALRQYFYRLVVKNIVSGEEKNYGPVSPTPDADLIALELRRHMGLLMREFAGRRTWVLPVRTFGQRCTCWNAVLQKRTRSGCHQCYDTGFMRGYLAPMEIWVQFDPGGNASEQNTNVGPMHQQNTTARVMDIGLIKPRDVLVEPENKRWRVTQVNQTEHGRAAVHYELQLHLIPKSDIEYSYEIPMEEAVQDLWMSPARNFTNPHNLESFENEEIPRIFNLYPGTYPDPER